MKYVSHRVVKKKIFNKNINQVSLIDFQAVTVISFLCWSVQKWLFLVHWTSCTCARTRAHTHTHHHHHQYRVGLQRRLAYSFRYQSYVILTTLQSPLSSSFCFRRTLHQLHVLYTLLLVTFVIYLLTVFDLDHIISWCSYP